MSELYNMQRYLAPGLLRSQGVYHFSDWAQTYGQTVQSVEVKPESNGFQVRERFAKFHNLPELMASFHMFADIMTQDDLDLGVPDVEVEVVAVEASDEQKQLVDMLADRADAIRAGGVDPAVDNLLKITSEGRALALSPRILDGIKRSEAEYGSEPGKLKACAEAIARVWADTSDERGTQLVFCDASTPSRDAWNVYDEIGAQLIGLGIPPQEIAFVHDYKTPKSRDALFEKVNAGEIRVLFGSTQKLGTGTNVQARLAAIHDVDCPWRPSDLEQRLGRVQRQGNMYSSVKDFRYVTTGTFDSYLYQTVERKQRFIAQVFTNKCPARSGDDLDETVLDYATIKAVASGDPAVRERLLKENRLQELEMQRQAHAKLLSSTRDDIQLKYGPAVELLSDKAAQLKDDAPLFQVVQGEIERAKTLSLPLAVEVQGRSFPSNQETAKEIVEFRRSCRTPGLHEFGSAYGARLGLMLDRELNARLCVIGEHCHEHDRPLSMQTVGPETCLRQLERTVSSVANGLSAVEERLEAARVRLRQAEREVEAGWDLQEEYDQLKTELASEDAVAIGRKDWGHMNANQSEGKPLDSEVGEKNMERIECLILKTGKEEYRGSPGKCIWHLDALDLEWESIAHLEFVGENVDTPNESIGGSPFSRMPLGVLSNLLAAADNVSIDDVKLLSLASDSISVPWEKVHVDGSQLEQSYTAISVGGALFITTSDWPSRALDGIRLEPTSEAIEVTEPVGRALAFEDEAFPRCDLQGIDLVRYGFPLYSGSSLEADAVIYERVSNHHDFVNLSDHLIEPMMSRPAFDDLNQEAVIQVVCNVLGDRASIGLPDDMGWPDITLDPLEDAREREVICDCVNGLLGREDVLLDSVVEDLESYVEEAVEDLVCGWRVEIVDRVAGHLRSEIARNPPLFGVQDAMPTHAQLIEGLESRFGMYSFAPSYQKLVDVYEAEHQEHGPAHCEAGIKM